jgi:hypothetical protein
MRAVRLDGPPFPVDPETHWNRSDDATQGNSMIRSSASVMDAPLWNRNGSRSPVSGVVYVPIHRIRPFPSPPARSAARISGTAADGLTGSGGRSAGSGSAAPPPRRLPPYARSRPPNLDGSMPAASQYFLTSRQGVLRSRCRRTRPVPSGRRGRKRGPSLSSLIPARAT